jgi:general secretion pathway protein G
VDDLAIYLIVAVALGYFVYYLYSAMYSPTALANTARSFVKQDLSSAITAYYKDTGRYPTTLDGLTALVDRPDNVSNWKGPYLNALDMPKDPWGNSYQYAYPARHKGVKFDAWSDGPDKVSGTDDDIGNW